MSQKVEFITILVLGAFSAGKTEIIRAVSEMDVVSTEFPPYQPSNPNVMSVAMDFGRLTFAENRCLYFLGQPGARRMPPLDMLPAQLMQRVGILFIVDSAKKPWDEEVEANPLEIYHEDIFQYHATVETGYPYIVLASKQDRDGARSPDELRAILGIPTEIPVLPTSATTDPASVKHAVLELLRQMPQDEIVKMAIENFPID